MEIWNKGNQMIRKIGLKEDPHGWLEMMEARVRSMEALASTHISWYTHKNPYGCWICDMFLAIQRVLDSFSEFLGPEDATAESQSTGSTASYESGASTDDSEIDDEHDKEEFQEED